MKANKIITITACIVLAAFVFGVSGIFNLVNASVAEAAFTDRLIGVLITREYLDLFDSEQYFKDNFNTLTNGGEISESKSLKYQGRIYASRVEASHTNDETGEADSGMEYVFDGVDGICFFTPLVTDKFGSYWSLGGDDAISDVHTGFNSTDDGESIALEGTVYVSTVGNSGNYFYFNPVYQTSDGEVYAVSGDGDYFGDNSVAGTSMSREIKEDQSSTVNDMTASSGSKIKVNICYMDKPEKVSILQFGEKNELLSKLKYDSDSFPDTLQVKPGTEYIIVETATASQEKDSGITREIFQAEDESLFAFFSRDDGLCVKRWCEINWNN